MKRVPEFLYAIGVFALLRAERYFFPLNLSLILITGIIVAAVGFYFFPIKIAVRRPTRPEWILLAAFGVLLCATATVFLIG